MSAVRKNYFDGAIAENYDRDSASMFDPGVVGATVGFLADLAGEGARLNSVSEPGASPCRWRRGQ